MIALLISGISFSQESETKNDSVKTLKEVVASVVEVETASLFYNYQTSVHLRHILEALGHPQIATPTKTDNSTVASFITDIIKKKSSKYWDKDYHWLCDQQLLDNVYFY